MCPNLGHYRICPQELYFVLQLCRKACGLLEGRRCLFLDRPQCRAGVLHIERGVRLASWFRVQTC